jgi:hypothetical protein
MILYSIGGDVESRARFNFERLATRSTGRIRTDLGKETVLKGTV